MKTGRITGTASVPAGIVNPHKCQDCSKTAKYRVFLRDLKMTIYVCEPCSTKYVW